MLKVAASMSIPEGSGEGKMILIALSCSSHGIVAIH